MKITESINRGFNLLAVSVLGLTGFAFASEIFLEKDWDDKSDDIGLLALGLCGIVWYLIGGNRFKRSAVPAVLMLLAMAVKIVGLAIEFHDPEAAGDDFGGVVLLVMAAGLVLYQFWKTKKLLRANPE